MQNRNQGITRRGFLSASISSLAAAGLAGLAPGTVLGQEAAKTETEPQREVIYRTLGRTGLKLPVVSMGVMNANNPEIVQSAYERGVRHFDTAAYYQYGRNEQMLGKVIKRLKARDQVAIATKAFARAQRRNLDASQAKAKFIQIVEGSLKRLDTDYVDIIYLHDVASAEEAKDPVVIEAMTELKEQKKVRFCGVSTHSSMAEVISEAVRGGFYDVVLTAINISLADNVELLNAIEQAAQAGVGIVAMKTQAGGARLPNPESLQNYSSSVLATAALKWVLNNKNITTAIPGYTNYEHLKEDFSVAYDLGYTDEEKSLLGENNIKLSLGFCEQCQLCLTTCPRNADIPTLMRTHMYAAQYANFHLARTVLDDIPRENSLSNCTNCDNCVARCANAVDIPRRIEELKLIYA